MLHDLPALEAMQTDPHVIGMLHREELWNAGAGKRGQAELILVKNSDNPLGTLRFADRLMRCRMVLDSVDLD